MTLSAAPAPTSSAPNSSAPTPTSAQPAAARASIASATVRAALFNAKNVLASPMAMVFSLGLPIFMYLMYGTGHSYAKLPMGDGNISARILINMTTYGVIVALSSMGAAVALERSNGWLRYVAMTPLGVKRWLASKMMAGLGIGAIIIAVCYGVGAFVQAEMTARAWISSAIAALLCAAMAMPFGLAVAMSLKSESAFSIVGGGTSLLAFSSGMFTPLHSMGSTMQTIGQFMPYYGTARIPEAMLWGIGHVTWKDWTSVIAWFAIFAFATVLAGRNKTGR